MLTPHASDTMTFVNKTLCIAWEKGQYYAPLPPVQAEVGLTGDLTVSKMDAPAIGAILESKC